MELKPLADRVVVSVAEPDTVSAGGIVLPTKIDKDKPFKGRVEAVGAGYRLSDGKVAPLEVNVGDVVLFPNYRGTEIELDAKKFLIVNADDILAVVQN